MSISNSNLKNVIQSRVSTATAAAPLKDLMLLSKAARGLNIDTTNLETLIAGKLNTLNGSSPLPDLLIGSLASGLIPDTSALLKLSNDAKTGDSVFVDCFGQVYAGQRSRTLSAGHTGAGSTGFHAYCTLDGFTQCTNNLNRAFVARLSDGNILVADGGVGSSIYGLRFRLLSADRQTVLRDNLATMSFTNTGNAPEFNGRVVAVFKSAENTFRFYYYHMTEGFSSFSHIACVVAIYNPANQTVTLGSKTNPYTSGSSDRSVNLAVSGLSVTDRYAILTNNNITYHYVADLSNGTQVELAAVRGRQIVAYPFVGPAGNQIALVADSNNQAFLVRTDGSTSALPSNMIADGAFSYSGFTRFNRALRRNVFLSVGNNAGTVKVITLNDALTSATIYTLATNPLLIPSLSNWRVIEAGSRYYVNNASGGGFSFELDANGVPSGFRYEGNTLKAQTALFASLPSPIFRPSDMYFCLTSLSNGTTNGAIFSGPLSEFMAKFPTQVGSAMTSGAAGSFVAVALRLDVQKADTSDNDLSKPTFQGYVVQEAPTTETMFDLKSGSYTMNSPLSFANEMVSGQSAYNGISLGSNFTAVLSAGQGVIFSNNGSASFSMVIASIYGQQTLGSSGSTTQSIAVGYVSAVPFLAGSPSGVSANLKLIR